MATRKVSEFIGATSATVEARIPFLEHDAARLSVITLENLLTSIGDDGIFDQIRMRADDHNVYTIRLVVVDGAPTFVIEA